MSGRDSAHAPGVLPAPRLARAPLTLASARFAHACNTRAKLAAACAADDETTNFLEADVCLAASAGGGGGSGGGGSSGAPPECVLAHAPGDPHDATLGELLRAARAAGKGVKLDIKQHAALAPALAALARADAEAEDDGGGAEWRALRLFRAQSALAASAGGGRSDGEAARARASKGAAPGPAAVVVAAHADADEDVVASGGQGAGEASFDVPAVIVNFDCLAARGASCAFNASGAPLPDRAAQEAAAAEAFASVGAALPLALVSLGWCTAREGGEYGADDVDSMARVVSDFAGAGAHVTFAVRASWVRRSLPQLLRLADARRFPGASLTVWSNVALPAREERWMRAALAAGRVPFAWDCPPPLPDQGGGNGEGEGAAESGAEAGAQAQAPLLWGLLAAAAAGAALALAASLLLVAARRRRP